LKQRVPITSKSSKFKGATQHYVVKLPKSTGASNYCPKIPQMPGTLVTQANSSPASMFLFVRVGQENTVNKYKEIIGIV